MSGLKNWIREAKQKSEHPRLTEGPVQSYTALDLRGYAGAKVEP